VPRNGTANSPAAPASAASSPAPAAQVEAMRVKVVAATAWIRLSVASAPLTRIVTTPLRVFTRERPRSICWARAWWGRVRRIGGTYRQPGVSHNPASPRRTPRRTHSALGSSHDPGNRLVATPARAIKRHRCCKSWYTHIHALLVFSGGPSSDSDPGHPAYFQFIGHSKVTVW
jgi:hypothetical protein